MKCQVLLSTYNGEKYLQEQIDSILQQKGLVVELLIRDDGSDDSTIKIIKSNLNLNFFLGENIGVVKSFFALLHESDSNCEYYAFSDQDDVWLDNKLAKAVSILQTYDIDKPCMYCSNLMVTDSCLNELYELNKKKINMSAESFLLNNCVTGCTVVINKAFRDLLLSLNIDLNNIVMHDWLFGFIAKRIGNLYYDNSCYILYRQHGDNVIGANTGKISLCDIFKKLYNCNYKLFNQIYEFNKIYKQMYYKNLDEYLLITNSDRFFNRFYALLKLPKLKRKNLYLTLSFKILYLIGYYRCSFMG